MTVMFMRLHPSHRPSSALGPTGYTDVWGLDGMEVNFPLIVLCFVFVAPTLLMDTPAFRNC